MPFYENIFIARQDVTTAQVEGPDRTLLRDRHRPGRQRHQEGILGPEEPLLPHPKNRKGHYILLNIDAPAAAVIEMERNMRIHEDVLRQLTVRVDELEEGPSAMMQSKGGRDREDREREGGSPP